MTPTTMLNIVVSGAPWIPIEEVRVIVNGSSWLTLTNDVMMAMRGRDRFGPQPWRIQLQPIALSRFPKDGRDAWLIVEAGMKLAKEVEDVDGDGLPDLPRGATPPETRSPICKRLRPASGPSPSRILSSSTATGTDGRRQGASADISVMAGARVLSSSLRGNRRGPGARRRRLHLIVPDGRSCCRGDHARRLRGDPQSLRRLRSDAAGPRGVLDRPRHARLLRQHHRRGKVRVRRRITPQSWLSLALDAINYRYVNNAGLASSGASFGPPTLGYHRTLLGAERLAIAAYARALLPLDSSQQSGVETGLELGASARRLLPHGFTLAGGLAVAAPVDIVAGQAHGRLEPVAAVELWLAPGPGWASSRGGRPGLRSCLMRPSSPRFRGREGGSAWGGGSGAPCWSSCPSWAGTGPTWWPASSPDMPP